MADLKSRYRNCRPFEADSAAGPVFMGLRPRIISPATPILEYGWKDSDRIELLAQHFYTEARAWWRILDANPDIVCAGDLPGQGKPGEPAASDGAQAGRVLLIPRTEE